MPVSDISFFILPELILNSDMISRVDNLLLTYHISQIVFLLTVSTIKLLSGSPIVSGFPESVSMNFCFLISVMLTTSTEFGVHAM